MLKVCMYSRCCALFSACISLVAFGHSSAETARHETLMVTHHAWMGHVYQTVTADSSVLTEYIAQTSSVNTIGAVFAVSMTPRFSCSPIVGIEIEDDTFVSRAADVEFSVVLDNRTIDFPVILDHVGSDARFTLSSAGSDQKKLRSAVDLASWATVKWSFNSDVPQLSNAESDSVDTRPATSGEIDFSLLGSQKTLRAMEEKCRSHMPIPLAN